MITSFTIDWYDCGLSAGCSIVHEKTTVSFGSPCKIIVRRYNGCNVKLQEHTYFIPEETAKNSENKIRTILENADTKTDYSVMVCDGYSWELRIRYSDAPMKKITGTAEPPAFGNALTEAIYAMLTETYCLDFPWLLGCDEEK